MMIRFLLPLFICGMSSGFAQTIYLKGGVNVSSLDYPSGVTVSSSSQTDFHFGVGVATEIANKLVFQFGAGYSRLAINPVSTSGFLLGSAVFKYHPIKEFNFHIGPYGGILISKDPSPGSIYGITPGVEYYFANNIGVGISYLYGLGESAAKTRAFQFSFIYRFNSLQLKNAGY
ncbi:MAG: hypothetical protein HOP30_06420 [Cyclobacteriaceae bacterium]|nr:hypothetical protein [Cyclobacteriaceae bacterium]